MRPPVIPETLAICVTCHNALAMEGKPECCDCLLETRFAAWALADGELPPGLRFVGDGATKTFVPQGPVGHRPCGSPVFEDPQFATPRIGEVPAASTRRKVPSSRSRHTEDAVRRVTAWVGLLVLWAFTAGLLFGRFA